LYGGYPTKFAQGALKMGLKISSTMGLKLSSKNLNLKKEVSRLKGKKVMRITKFADRRQTAD
jgi:hypothetical protein